MENIEKLIEQGILIKVHNGDLLDDLMQEPEPIVPNDTRVVDERYRYIFEFFVYDINTNELLEQSIINVLSEWNNSIFIDSNQLLINPGIHLRNLGYSSGNYKIKYKFLKTIVGSPNSDKLSIKRISPSRKEIEIITPEGLNEIVAQLTKERIDLYSLNQIQRDYVNFIQRRNNVSKLTTYLNFGFDKTFLIVNSKHINDIDLLLKLYQPLTTDIQQFDSCYICEEVLQPYEDKIVLYTEKIDDTSNLIYLRKPDVDYNSAGIHYRTTPLENFDALVTSNREIKSEIMRYYLSSSLIEGTKLNIDYRQFDNFVKFSSIETRLINFKQKIKNIEFYNSKINQYYTGSIGSASLSTPEISSSINYYRNLKQNIINEFDNYDRFLYYESSSYESSSIGEFYESTWPKYTSTKPYLFYSYTSSQAQQWYSGMIESASIYDNMNKDLYSNFVPLDMQLDDQNKSFVKFVNMIGHYFDIINIYIKEMPSWHYKDNSIDEGIPKDLIIHAINHYGFDLKSGNVIKSLFACIPSASITGSF